MNDPAQHLYTFLTACSGNWRNSIHISCPDVTDVPGYLLAVDRDGQPVLMSIPQFHQLTGIWIEPDECCGHLSEAGFEALYAQYLLWHCASSDAHPLRRLCSDICLND